jgi:hypothetical protein
MGQLIPWIQITIPGFVYVSSVFFLILFFAGKYDLTFSKDTREYVPFIAILAIFFSYVVGFSAHLISEKVISIICSEYKLSISNFKGMQKIISDNVFKSLSDTYVDFVMLRHLSVSTFFLGLTLYNWFRKSKTPQFKWLSISACFLFTIIFVYAYFEQKEILNVIKQSISAP